jgi:hypothetical protein
MSILTAPSALKVPFSCRTVKFSACVPGPVHGVRIDRMIVRVEHFHVHAREIGRVFAHMRALPAICRFSGVDRTSLALS